LKKVKKNQLYNLKSSKTNLLSPPKRTSPIFQGFVLYFFLLTHCLSVAFRAWCYYDFDEKNEKYGLLYNGYVFMDNPGAISQDGFTSATYADWNKLADFIGGKNYVDTLKSSEGWEKVETDENDIKHSTPLQYSDDHDFKCIPSGWVNEKGVFYQLGSISKFWTDTDDDTGKLWARIVGLIFISTAVNPENGYSVRLIKE
jgi:uncharacterized protein (TIGR02145 family)